MATRPLFVNDTMAEDPTTLTTTATSTTGLPDVAKNSANTIVVVFLCVCYFWCASFSTYEFIAKRALLSPVIKALQLCLSIQSFLRCVFIALAYFVTPSSTLTAEFELAMLGDLPGIFYGFIWVWLCCDLIKIRFNMRTNRGQCRDLTLKIAMIMFAIVFLIAWSSVVAMLSTQTSAGDRMEPSQIVRVTTFDLLFGLVTCTAVISACLLRAVEETKIVQKYRVRKKHLTATSIVVAVCFLLRVVFVTYLVIEETVRNEAHRWVLLLDNEDPWYLVAVVAYYFIGEVLCTFVAAFLLRNRLFGNEHQLLLERGFLEKDLELRARDMVINAAPMSRGGFGAVYKARYKGCIVAVKKFLEVTPRGPDQSNNAEEGNRRRRFVQEAEFLSRLRHPRIVQYLGYVYLDGPSKSFSIVTEFVAGGSLFSLLHTRKTNTASLWTIEDALRVGKQMCEGMAFLHSHSIIHRDIKSANILLDRHRRAVKICDFGLSKLFDAYRVAPAMAATSTCGTPYWAAPELLRAEAALPMSDIYSFGITMYEMLSRQIPFKDLDRRTVVRRVRRGALKPDLPGWTPQRVELLVQRCWKQKPEDRPSADILMSDLTDLLKEMERSDEGCKVLAIPIRGPNQQFPDPGDSPRHPRQNSSHRAKVRHGRRAGSRDYKAMGTSGAKVSTHVRHKKLRHKSSSLQIGGPPPMPIRSRRGESKIRRKTMHEVAENISLLDGVPENVMK